MTQCDWNSQPPERAHLRCTNAAAWWAPAELRWWDPNEFLGLPPGEPLSPPKWCAQHKSNDDVSIDLAAFLGVIPSEEPA